MDTSNRWIRSIHCALSQRSGMSRVISEEKVVPELEHMLSPSLPSV
jgi:hypothetical protein